MHAEEGGGWSREGVGQPRHRPHRLPPTRCHPMLAAPSRAWRVCTQIFADPWEAFPHAHARAQPPSSAGLVAPMLACGTPAKLGDRESCCRPCGQGQPLGAMRWKSSWCLRCANVQGDHWVSQGSQVLHAGGISRHSSLTVPAMVRPTFSQHAAVVVRACRRCGAPCRDDCDREGRGQARRGGAIVVLHPPGRHGQDPPHLQGLATRGGSDGQQARGEHRQSLP